VYPRRRDDVDVSARANAFLSQRLIAHGLRLTAPWDTIPAFTGGLRVAASTDYLDFDSLLTEEQRLVRDTVGATTR